jgi:hypothetical protein
VPGKLVTSVFRGRSDTLAKRRAVSSIALAAGRRSVLAAPEDRPDRARATAHD